MLAACDACTRRDELLRRPGLWAEAGAETGLRQPMGTAAASERGQE